MLLLISAAVSGQIRNIPGTELMSIRSIAEEEDGRIWFSTDKTLFSYDGYDLRRFPNDDGSVQGNALIISGDRIFIGSNRGLYIFNKNSYRFSKCPGLSETMITGMVEMDGVIYVGTDSGLYSVEINDNPTAQILSEETKGWVILSLMGRNGILYLGLLNSYNTYDLKSRTLNMPPGDLGRGKYVTAITFNDQKELMVGCPDGLQIGEESGSEIKHARFNVVKSICQDGESTYFIGTDTGLYLYDSSDDSSTHIDDCTTWTITKSQNGDFWFGTDNGLFYYSRSRISTTFPGLEDVGRTLFYSALRDSKGRTWFCTSSGIALCDGSGTTWFNIESPDHTIIHNKVKEIIETTSGEIVAVSDIGWMIYNEKTGQMDRRALPGSGGWHNWFYDVKSQFGRLWMASYSGVVVLKGNDVEKIITTEDGLSMNDVANIEFDKNRNLWILTRDQKLSVYDTDNESSTKVDGLYGVNVDTIEADRDGNMWVASRNIVYFYPINGDPVEVELYSQSNGTIYDMADVGTKMIVTTINGIYYIDKATRKSGLISNRGRYIGLYADDSERNLLVLTSGSVRIISYDMIEQLSSERTRKFYVSNVEVNGVSLTPGEYMRNGRLVLPHYKNNLRISLTDYSFAGDRKHPFSYEIRKGNRKGSSTTQNNTIVLHSLTPGRYTLISNPGDKNTRETIYTFKIQSPWFVRWYAIILYIGILLVIANWARKYLEVKKNLQKARKKEEFFDEIANKEVGEELSYDEMAIQKITKVIEDNIQDPNLTISTLSAKTGLTEKQLYRKIKQATGQSAVEYVRSLRLKKAALLLQKGTYTISEVMYNVGFLSMSYFSRTFSEMFGQTPSAFMKSGKIDNTAKKK